MLGSLVSVHIIWVSCQSLYDAGMILRSHMARRVCFFLVSLYELTYDPGWKGAIFGFWSHLWISFGMLFSSSDTPLLRAVIS